jgi:hypothetical protein
MARRRRRPPWWLLLFTVVGLGAVVALLVVGSGSSEPRLTLRAELVPAAVAAVEERLGGGQRYTEVNATAEGVNVFVAGAGGTEASWSYAGGLLDGPGPSVVAGPEHPEFTLDGVAVDRAEELARAAQEQFPTATLTRFALRKAGDGTVVWSIALRSSRGGLIEVTFTGAGGYIGADLR